MAGIQDKHSPSRAQGSRRSAQAPTKPAVVKSAKTKSETSTRKHRKRERLPPSLRFTETKRGKTTVRRYSGRTFYRFEEVKGKVVDLVEVLSQARTIRLTSTFRTRPRCIFPSIPGSSWKPNTPM